MILRPETTGDFAGVRWINERAFGRLTEADLVDALRPTSHAALSLVAEADSRLVGHIFFTRVTLESDDGCSPATAIGPMAVLPEYQRRGIGSQLVRAGLEHCRGARHDIVFVLGHPDFYPRFGFRPAAPLGITCRWDVPADAFMIDELTSGALRGRRGLVRYAPAFERA